MKADPVDKAIKNLWLKRIFWHGERRLVVACLLRSEDIRPLKALWWRGKEAYLIGADLTGNFFLRHCDGSVRYWDHAKQVDEVISPSVHEFLAHLEEDENT
jgi:hypothetical protein